MNTVTTTVTDSKGLPIDLGDKVMTPDGMAKVLDIDAEPNIVTVIHNAVYAGGDDRQAKDYSIMYDAGQVDVIKEWVIICESKHRAPGEFPQVWTIKETSDPDRLVASIKMEIQSDYEERLKQWSQEEWMRIYKTPLRDTSDTVRAVTWPQYQKMERDHLLGDRKLHMETYREFMDALEVLPPEQWTNEGGFERFLMSEYYTSSYTTQHARVKVADDKHVCGCRLVDALDKSTWITREQLLDAYETQEPPVATFTKMGAARCVGLPDSIYNPRDYTEYVDVEMWGAVEITDEDTGEAYIERMHEVDLTKLFDEGRINEVMWTIYGIPKDEGGSMVLFDFRTKLEAENALAKIKHDLLNPYNF